VVTRVPATTGATLRRLLQVRAVRYVQNELGHYFNNNLVLFLSGMRNYDMAVALSDYTPKPELRRRAVPDRRADHADSLSSSSSMPRAATWMLSGKPGEMLESALSGFKSSRIAAAVAKSHVIVGTFAELKAVGNAKPTWPARPSSPRRSTTSGWPSSRTSARSTWWSTSRPSCSTAWSASTSSRR
jgi:hypothetical protein